MVRYQFKITSKITKITVIYSVMMLTQTFSSLQKCKIASFCNKRYQKTTTDTLLSHFMHKYVTLALLAQWLFCSYFSSKLITKSQNHLIKKINEYITI